MKENFSMKKMFEISRKEQKEKFNEIMNWVEINNCKDDDKTDDTLFFILDKMKVYFFAFMDEKEKERYVLESIKYIKKRNDFVYQLLETMSVIYKFIPKNLQNMIFDAFFDTYENLLESNRGITTVSIFIKNTHKCYNQKQFDIYENIIMKKFENVCKGPLRDTFEYIAENCKRKFAKTKEAKVLLLIPEFQTATSFVQPPLCMMNVYSDLKGKNINVDIMDNRIYSYSFEQLASLINNYEVIALTSTPLDQVQTYFLDYRHTLFCNMVNFLKSKLKENTKIIICGSHGTVRPDIIQRTCSADIILKGEYDFQLGDLIEKIIHNDNIDNFPNIIFKHDGKYITNRIDLEKMHPKQWTESIIDYSILPVADYYGYQYINNTHLKKKNWAVMQTTRGCPYNCIFCFNFYTRTVRFKNIENIIKELKQLKKEGTKEIFFIDQTFTVNPDYTQDLCKRIIEANINIPWTCETRIDLIDEQTLKLMKKAGCYAIWFGVESFDEEVLKLNQKGYTKTDFSSTIELLNKYNMDYRAFIMIGMKGETKESLKKTVDRIVKYKIKLSKTIVQCQERFGTKMFDDIDENTKKKLNRFEILGLRKGRLSDKIDQNDINEAVKELILLANKN